MSETHHYRDLLPVSKHRILGSCIANLMGVATGKFLACFMKAKIWDIAAGVLLVEEAGGVVHSNPDYHELELSKYDCEDPVKIEIHAKANNQLADFESILLKKP
jgi:fructose-1,6-bisphosphatase/inositol monophosphatase family enzyme